MRRKLAATGIRYTVCAVSAYLLARFLGFDVGKKIFSMLLVCGACALCTCKTLYEERHEVKNGVAVRTDRKSELDILRILAVVLVIVLHTVEAAQGDSAFLPDQAFASLCSVLLSCNILFIMLSGALAFRWTDKHPVLYYVERAVRILVPMFIYYFWNYFYDKLTLGELSDPELFKLTCLNLRIGNTEFAPQFWLIYPILAIYIAAPFIRYLVKDMPYRMLCFGTAAGLLCCIAHAQLNTPINSYLPYYLIIALIGYWIYEERTRKYDPIICAIGAVALGILIITGQGIEEGECWTVMITCAIISLVYICCQHIRIGNKASKVLAFLSRYSFGAMLIHWWVLYFIVRGRMGLSGIGTAVPVILITFGMSLGMAYLIDNTAVYIIKKFLEILISWCETAICSSERRK